MSRHQFDLVMCMKQPGTHIGLLCEKCDGKCPICDSYIRPKNKVKICHNCAFGKSGSSCIICGNPGINKAYYCWECCKQEKDRDGCPKIINIGSNRTDKYFEKKSIEHK
ncbi:U2 snRNP complex subunit RDS3 NDAI_0A04940 [Naumovozyma dairenensis CBS 421]|uniref:Pre-mRNA-splicing factor RDS3 n=1 Tax=Naumovozyma dairenensis (strain ATCC 10597 / BCRC 20456 / CBS 421 / NBRC 0211 / NRRL Y-12639) TaxID=1071378 RepID=G0W4B1_NAUDC|nr:hypothetical protein NDAI_0A04940 [Naumovozyma dairenensis CBS 421]CCD22649.1 hypothetical protein NDAI_0A04940 [Naumovozyma dairenensis CBS 421]